jgi:non-homologous end joining protein Ku
MIAGALSVSIFAFFDSYADAPYSVTPDEKRLIEAYRTIKDGISRDGLLALAEHAAKK